MGLDSRLLILTVDKERNVVIERSMILLREGEGTRAYSKHVSLADMTIVVVIGIRSRGRNLKNL